MIELKLIQSSVGKYNLLSSDKSFSFSMGLYEDGKIIDIGGTKAIIYYSGDPEDEEEFTDCFSQIDSIFEKCYKYSQNVISSTDYEKQCLLFSTIYMKRYDEINANVKEKELKIAETKLKNIQNRLVELKNENYEEIPDISYAIKKVIRHEIEKYKHFIKSEEITISQLKEDTKMHAKSSERLRRYDAKIKELQELMFEQELK